MKKKVLLILFALFSVFGVKAEDTRYKENIIKMDQKSYAKGEFKKGDGNFCGFSNPDFLFVTKQNKVVFYDRGTNDYDDYSKYKMWDEKDGCQNMTQEDLFEIFDYKFKSYDFDCDDAERLEEGQEQKCYIYLYEELNVPDETYIIKNYDEYDENRFYWKKVGEEFNWIIENKEEYVKSHINEVYYYSHFRHVTSKNLDPNERYYILNNNQMEEYTGLLSDITDFNNLYIAISDYEEYKIIAEFPVQRINGFEELYQDVSAIYINGKGYLNFVNFDTLEAVTYDEKFNKIDELDNIFFQNSQVSLSKGSYAMGIDLTTLAPGNLVKINIYDVDFDIIDTIEYDGLGQTEILNGLDSEGRVYFVIYDNINDDSYFKTLIYYDTYKVLDGDNQTIVDKDISIRYNGALEKFDHLEINGKMVPEKYYTLKSGSTIVTLDNKYLNSLSKGENRVTAFFKVDGSDNLAEATAILIKKDNPKPIDPKKEDNVIENEEVPKTGDNVITYTIVSVVSLVTLVASYRYLKKSKKGF